MNRPLPAPGARRLRSNRAASSNTATVRQSARPSFLTSAMVWILIVYLVVPIQYFGGNFDLGNDSSFGAPNPLARTIKLGLLFTGVVVILWRSRLATLELRSLNPMFLGFLALVPVSAIWSIDSSATINRFISLLSIVVVCLAFVIHGWTRTRFQDVLRPLIVCLLLASLIFGMAYPEYAIEVGEGTLKDSWRGLTSQKNQFGMLSSFGVVFWLHAWLNKERKWWACLPWILMSFMCVLLSRSSTSLMATTLSTVFMLLLMAAPPGLRRYMPYIVSVFATIVIVYALAVLNIIPGSSLLLDPIAELTGKDMTFSNRAVIWDIIKEHIQLAPLLGSGYGAYWTGPNPSSPSYTFLGRMYFYPSQAHNGYLEIVNDLGFVGLACLLGYLFYWIRQSLQLMRIDRGQTMLFLGLFFQQAVTNLSESTWFAINSAFAIAVATMATFAMTRSLLESTLQSASGVARRAARTQRFQ